MPRRPLLLAATGAVIVAAGAAAVLGPGAAPLVDALADGREVWRLGHMRVDGVSGAWLGALRAKHVTIADENGIWLDARDVTLDWRPFDLFGALVSLERARIGRIDLLRRPALSAPRDTGGGGVDVHIGGLQAASIHVGDGVAGEAADFHAQLSLEVRAKNLHALELALDRTDAGADRLRASLRDGVILNAELDGAAGGVFAHALGVADQAVTARAASEGDRDAGSARYDAMIGETSLLHAEASWRDARWSIDALAELGALPALSPLATRIGSPVALHAASAGGDALTAHAETPFITADANGALDALHFTATTERLSDIAREAPFSFGPARLEGELRSNDAASAIRATLDARELDALGQRARFSGPIEASLNPNAFQLSAELSSAGAAPPLFVGGTLATALSYDRRRGRFALERATLRSDALEVSAQGWANGGDGEFSGAWRVRDLHALGGSVTGAASGQWRAAALPQGNGRVWSTTFSGQGAQIGGEPTLAQLLGRTPQIDALLRNEDGGVTVDHVRINGARLRAGARGRIVRGMANLALEGSARGPVRFGDMDIAGAADATGRLSGRLARPALSARVVASNLSMGGVDIAQPALDFTLSPGPTQYAGEAKLAGQISGQPLQATSIVEWRADGLRLPHLDARLGRLQAQGEALLGAHPRANLRLSGALDDLAPGARGLIAGSFAYSDRAIQLDAAIADARIGALRVRSSTLHAAGPPGAIDARFELSGRLNQAPLTFAGTGALRDGRDGQTLSVSGAGELAQTAFATRTPIQWRRSGREQVSSIDVTLGDGVFAGEWRERGRALTGTVQVEGAPLAPLAAIWGERASGSIAGTAELSSSGAGLSGTADLQLNDARLAGRQRGALDMRILARLAPDRLTANLDASSSDGLTAHLEADAPVVTAAAPLRIALAPERRGRARWSVRGPAESLWAAARLPDQSLSGNLDGEGELQFGAGFLSGDGYFEIAGGRFEDKRTGINLIDLDARVDIGDNGLVIHHLTANTPRGGRLTATGGSANPREGSIAVRVDDMRIANRPEARATASGDLTFSWEGLHAKLAGALDITQADLDIAADPEAGIPTIDVVEINRPDEIDTWYEDEAPQQNGSTELDVQIRAPGRVFTRGRGVDAEWSLDLRLAGTAADPRIFGEARAVRGTLALSGQPFDIESARILFNGDPLDAQIDLTAQRDTADLTARIRLTGTARDPEIAFSSDPALPEDEILPQVLFGRSVADLSPFEAAQLAASLAALSGRASLNLVDAARAAAGLDRFNVRQDENGGFLVAGGVYLTRDVYVEVARTGLGQAQTRVEWTLRPRLVLVTSFVGNGDQRVSLRWRRESD